MNNQLEYPFHVDLKDAFKLKYINYCKPLWHKSVCVYKFTNEKEKTINFKYIIPINCISKTTLNTKDLIEDELEVLLNHISKEEKQFRLIDTNISERVIIIGVKINFKE